MPGHVAECAVGQEVLQPPEHLLLDDLLLELCEALAGDSRVRRPVLEVDERPRQVRDVRRLALRRDEPRVLDDHATLSGSVTSLPSTCRLRASAPRGKRSHSAGARLGSRSGRLPRSSVSTLSGPTSGSPAHTVRWNVSNTLRTRWKWSSPLRTRSPLPRSKRITTSNGASITSPRDRRRGRYVRPLLRREAQPGSAAFGLLIGDHLGPVCTLPRTLAARGPRNAVIQHTTDLAEKVGGKPEFLEILLVRLTYRLKGDWIALAYAWTRKVHQHRAVSRIDVKGIVAASCGLRLLHGTEPPGGQEDADDSITPEELNTIRSTTTRPSPQRGDLSGSQEHRKPRPAASGAFLAFEPQPIVGDREAKEPDPIGSHPKVG